MFAMLGVDAVLRLVMIERRIAQKWLDAEAVHTNRIDVRPDFDSPTSLTWCLEFFDTSHTRTGTGNETTDKGPISSQVPYHQISPDTKTSAVVSNARRSR